jgi:hypothetical protein
MPRTWLKARQWGTVTKQHNNTDEIITKNKYLIIFLSYYQQPENEWYFITIILLFMQTFNQY